jgi:small subunit ribosomal protein S16
MLVIRMQRTGRKGHAQFRVVVQDSRRTPTSGKIVANLGHFNPHTKETSLDKEKASKFLNNGAQPSERVIRLLKAEGVKMPAWVNVPADKSRTIRHSDKLRRNRPAEETPAAAPSEAPTEPEAPVENDIEAAEPVAEAQAAAEAATEAATEEPASEEPPTEAAEPAADEVPAADTDAK